MIRTIAVLAAGRSERFGPENKLLVRLGAKPLAAHVADRLRAIDADYRLAVVSDPDVAALFHGFDILHPDVTPFGQSDSLRIAAQRARDLGSDRLLIALADMPFLGQDVFERVLVHATDDEPCAVTDGKRRCPPACFPRSTFPDLLDRRGDQGARSLLTALPDSALISVPTDQLRDIDTRGDLDQ